ncbi:MAG: cobalamin biosynthesis protein [Canidatus Methanoxibalbensis ujae]|nr:cobalamin biosynthesis protein [Candidatus Methanoxibalbensis ujae]MCW7078905.1 cobalamin biosynthesis protein [Candidatus Methanoxibalbensis ujae]
MRNRQKAYIGMGFHRDVSESELKQAILMFLDELGIDEEEVKGLCTADFRVTEALKAVSSDLGIPLFVFSRSEINSVEVRSESKAAMKALNVKGVSEPCAILGAIGDIAESGGGSGCRDSCGGGMLRVERRSFDRKITLAVAIVDVRRGRMRCCR